MSDMNALGNVLVDMGDNLGKLRTNLVQSIERLNAERDVLIKAVNTYYEVAGQIIMDHIREVEKLQGAEPTPPDPEDANHYGGIR